MIHHTGKTSFAIVAQEKKTKQGYSLTRVEMFIDCYSKADDEATREAIANMRELNTLAPEGPGDSTKKDDIFSKVMGQEKPGHVRMYGLGVCPSDLWGPTPSRATSHRMAIELKTTLDKVMGQYDELSNKFESINS